ARRRPGPHAPRRRGLAAAGHAAARARRGGARTSAPPAPARRAPGRDADREQGGAALTDPCGGGAPRCPAARAPRLADDGRGLPLELADETSRAPLRAGRLDPATGEVTVFETGTDPRLPGLARVLAAHPGAVVV